MVMFTRAALPALLSLAGLAAPSGVTARDARELITPRGWEIDPPAVADVREDQALPDDELLVPLGWRGSAPCGPQLRVGGDVCSELLVPVDWSALLRERTALPRS